MWPIKATVSDKQGAVLMEENGLIIPMMMTERWRNLGHLLRDGLPSYLAHTQICLLRLTQEMAQWLYYQHKVETEFVQICPTLVIYV